VNTDALVSIFSNTPTLIPSNHITILLNISYVIHSLTEDIGFLFPPRFVLLPLRPQPMAPLPITSAHGDAERFEDLAYDAFRHGLSKWCYGNNAPEVPVLRAPTRLNRFVRQLKGPALENTSRVLSNICHNVEAKISNCIQRMKKVSFG
jgi:hypothetical protein